MNDHHQPIRIEKTIKNENLDDEIYSLVSIIRPKWTRLNTKMKIFTEGITNKIYGLFDETINENDGLVIKLFGDQTDLFIDRQNELESMIKLSKYHVLSQEIRILFQNGFIYDFVPGRPCSRDDVRKPEISKLIAEKLAQFHSVPINDFHQPYFMKLIRKFLEILHQHQHKEKDFYENDVNFIEKYILDDLIKHSKFGEDFVLCHNDLLVKNIIYHETTNQISFIDFEYTNINYSLFDIANHFVEYAGVDDADFNIYPTRDEQKSWLKIYFQARNRFDILIDDDLCHLIERFAALAHLMWGLWALVQSYLSFIDFDYLNYAKLRFENYQKLKEILFGHFQQEK